MNDALKTLVNLLELETLEETLFRGQSQDLGFPQLYGGQVLGQALAAAARTVEPDRLPHSQHGYFLRPGDPHRPVVYQVDNVRDGRGFTTRRVTAIQKGRPIFFCSASFQLREPGFTHQLAMPDVPSPESLIEEGNVKHERFPGHPIEFLHLDNNPTPAAPAGRGLWFRIKGELPDDPALHRHLLSYSSDFNLLTTGLIPHGVEFRDPKLRIASLDHALWLHEDTRIDEWLFYSIDSPWAGSARGLARGSIFDRHGRLVASTAQEGLTRYPQA